MRNRFPVLAVLLAIFALLVFVQWTDTECEARALHAENRKVRAEKDEALDDLIQAYVEVDLEHARNRVLQNPLPAEELEIPSYLLLYDN